MSFLQKLKQIEELIERKIKPEVVSQIETALIQHIARVRDLAIVSILKNDDFIVHIPGAIYDVIIDKRFYALDDVHAERNLIVNIVSNSVMSIADKVMLSMFDGLTIVNHYCRVGKDPVKNIGYIVSRSNNIAHLGTLISREIRGPDFELKA